MSAIGKVLQYFGKSGVQVEGDLSHLDVTLKASRSWKNLGTVHVYADKSAWTGFPRRNVADVYLDRGDAWVNVNPENASKQGLSAGRVFDAVAPAFEHAGLNAKIYGQ